MKTLLAVLILTFSFSFPALANHNPENDAGKVVRISAWCKEVEEVKRLLEFMHAEDADSMIKMYTNSNPKEGGSSCVHIKAVQQAIRIPFPPLTVEILGIVDEVIAPDGTIGAIVKVKTTKDKIVYTWHHYSFPESPADD